jgi:hypothetical protein
MQEDLGRVEREIINYLRSNPRSSKADIIRHFRDIQLASRMTVLQYIKELETRNIIYGKKERLNSQSFMMYVNEDNEFLSVLTELEEFKEAYFNLLEKSKEFIVNKDYSVDAKALGIEEKDPAKWSKEDKSRYLELVNTKLHDVGKQAKEKLREKSRFKLADERIDQFFHKLNEIFYDDRRMESLAKDGKAGIEKLVDELGNIAQGSLDKKLILPTIRDYMIAFKNEISESSQFKQKIIETIKGEGGFLILIIQVVSIFYLFTDIMFFRSTLKWSETIQDKETLSRIYFVVYIKAVEIQFELSRFIRSTKIFSGNSDSSILRSLVKAKQQSPNILPSIIWSFKVLNMSPEIERVVTSLRNLNREIVEFDILDFLTTETDLDIVQAIERSHKKEAEVTMVLKNIEDILSH